MAELSLGGFPLHYEDSGSAGEPLALIHGSWGDHHQWDPVALRLSESYRVLSYDRRGHGASLAPGRPMYLADQVADLSALLSIVGRGPLHLVGSGAGAIIALELALLRPDQVRSVNIHEPPLVGLLAGVPQCDRLHANFREFEQRVVTQLQAGDRAPAAQAYANGVSAEAGGWAELSVPVQRALVANAYASLRESSDPGYEIMELDRFATYRDAIVLTGGSRSAPAFGAVNDRLAAALYGALRYSFEGAGHFPHVTHPDEFVRVVGEFCRFASRR
ncbi:MAG: alpha/beta hydrolase [Thermoplasmata archaeon]|nr:alpha/beta hydrolase [Thermoplasmata archaeon]